MAHVPVLEPEISPNFVGLPLDLSGLALPPHLGFSYTKKPEFHLTLIGNGHHFVESVASCTRSDRDRAKDVSTHACRTAIQGISFQVSIEPQFFRVEKAYQNPDHRRISIVALCKVDMSQDFYRLLQTTIPGVVVEPPPFHVTLYTHDDEMSRKGIGITNSAEFERNAVNITMSPFAKMLSTIIR
ncbi:MAG TPA: hypothetical protein VIR98_02750 [Candidatus Paceibacterota bacterium]|jgi:hypothetical protein